MNSDISVDSAILSDNPFSDEYVLDIDTVLEDAPSVTTKPREIIVPARYTGPIPILEPLPHLTVWSPQSSISSSSTTSSPTEHSFAGPIHWNNADLMYLLSCLLPDLLLTSQLVFSPPLVDLPTTPSPIHLRLYKRYPALDPSPEIFSKHAPIGTGRPQSLLLIAEAEECQTAEYARVCLAKNILSNDGFVTYMLDKYNVLTTLHGCSTATLLSLQRGMIEMLGVSELEWIGRFEQLGGNVDGACGLEARVEVFLLGVGMRETEEWVEVLETVMEMGERERKVWMEVYADAAGFLGRCVAEMWE
ncbi:hypothetical protein HBI25_189730 [Parastagonospora nodorum]|nr:hypothetical protein HBH50_189360 [Parastagonospora nodorum]KAH4082996.1 hypothetical protein HBH48_178130 [Parastagonospora nodorum]KAH4178142.1 hypothetical protein HBH43_041040 [Parastagonospora nodorum]KAH4198992.1 hypothetical protein HBH42_051600 [Parastagonospora nodorum]KAH4290997.1 hypothetical protein HBI01_195230 [Parastagonospora nodorum]